MEYTHYKSVLYTYFAALGVIYGTEWRMSRFNRNVSSAGEIRKYSWHYSRITVNYTADTKKIVCTSDKTMMVAIFWDSDGVIRTYRIPKGTTVTTVLRDTNFEVVSQPPY